MSQFVSVGDTSEVPEGAMKPFDLQGKQVAVANVSGTLYAFGDVCTHEHCSLAEGTLEGTRVECPCHGSTFDVTSGEVLVGPAAEPVLTYPVRVEGNLIQIEA